MITSYEQIRAEGNLPDEFPEAKILPHLQHAEARMRKLLTDTVYDTVLAMEDPGFELDTLGDLDANGKKRFFLAKAEALLACAFGTPRWALIVVNDGYRRSGGFGDKTWENLGKEEIDGIAARFLELAMEYIEPYKPADDPDDDEDDDTMSAGSLSMAAI